MRVLVIAWGCDREDISEAGVTARWVDELVKEHEVTLFAVSKPERFGCVREQFPDTEVFEWKDIAMFNRFERFRAIVKPGYFFYFPRARRFLRKLLGEREFDIIHHLSPFSWRYPTPAAGLGVPVVRGPVAGGLATPIGLQRVAHDKRHKFMWLRKADRARLHMDPLLRHVFQKTDHVLVAAPYVREILRPLKIRSWSVEIEHGLAEVPPHRNRADDGELRVLFVGRIVATKGVRLAIRAFAAAGCRNNATFTVIGDGQELETCKAEAAALGVEGRVHFLGWLTHKEVQARYREAHVFLFPSFREPTGGVLLEAMSNGLPIIACSYGGPEYMVDDSCGLKVPLGNEAEYVNGLSRALDKLAADRELRERLSQNAYRRAKSQFGWDAKRIRVSELYRRLVQ